MSTIVQRFTVHINKVHTSVDNAMDHGVWLLPFVCESQGKSLNQLLCFAANQSICGDDKRCEVSMLCNTGVKILMLFHAFFHSKDLVRVL
jgi:hypothetical protein